MSRYRVLRYNPNDKMAVVILQNYNMIRVIERFGITLGFKDDSIEEVCRKQKIDTTTLLAIVNLLTAGERAKIDHKQLSIEALMTYIKRSHHYFLEYKLPAIRKDLIATIGEKEAISIAVVNYFDEYVGEIQNHMEFEERVLFRYVDDLLNGNDQTSRVDIEEFCDNHESMEAKLTELKSILIKYYPTQSNYELSSVLVDIFKCEEELSDHARIEDLLFTPAIKELER